MGMPRYSIEHTTIVLVLRILERQHRTAKELAEHIGLERRSGLRFCHWLHERRLIHVASWRCVSIGPYVAVWGLGDQPDAQKPARPTPAARAKKWRRRHVKHKAAA